ncbi:MAG: response regulator transcription factor [Chloroflexota bacterium]|nr:response regulator transcription factor [Chloroflexota bacterium]
MSTVNPVRVMLVDDHALMRAGIRTVLESRHVEVIGEADNDERLIRTAAIQQPDVILFDADDKGLGIVPELLAATGPARLIVLSDTERDEIGFMVMQSGAHGVIWKSDSPQLLVKAIHMVHEGELWFSRSMMARMLTDMQRPNESSPDETRIAMLTSREREVIQLLGEGLKNQEIGERLHISESTVRHHFTSVYSKLHVSDRLELLIYAYRYRLVGQGSHLLP